MQVVSAQGAHVPAIGLGTYRLTGRACEEAVAQALALGYRHIDTARAYANEREVGRALRRSCIRRSELWVTTKIWPDALTYRGVMLSTARSLEELQTEYVDLMLIHWPSSEVPLEETFGALLELQGRGQIRHLGVSNFTPRLLRDALARGPVLCNQIEYHPFLGQDELLRLAREHGLLLAAYAPLARGRVDEEPLLRAIATRHGKTPAQIALRWLVQQQIVVAIPKATSAQHQRENLQVFDFALSAEEMAAIGGLRRGERLVNPEYAPDWEA